jgi:trimeric autotransporter adhesin
MAPNALPGGISSFWLPAGVSGYSTTGYGLNGVSETIGVQGVVVTPGGGPAGIQARGRLGLLTGGNYFGVYSNGNAHVAGTLSKTGGSFKIDHPVDPENKTLSHSFVESPDMMNIYNGNVTLDPEGRAVVQMPDYFQALNRDFRYQLTPIGAPGPNLYIEQKMTGNQFIIAGGHPAMEVSWQVTGVRQDAWAERFRIPVEELKRPEDRGYYLNPEAFDLPAEKSIEAAEESRRPGGRERIR